MVEEVGDICYHHFHRNHTWVGKCPMGSGRLCVGTKAAKQAVSQGKKTAFADVGREDSFRVVIETKPSFAQFYETKFDDITGICIVADQALESSLTS